MKGKYSGVLSALAAFTLWGFLPVYWKQLQAVDAVEILCHRAVWSCLFLCLIISFQKRWPELRLAFKDSGQLKRLFFSGLLIGLNWFVYIWAVNSGHVVETSLGYYITPMVNILFGFLLLGERFSRSQLIAIGCVVVGVSYSLVSYGSLPVFGLTLAFSFACYGYARKKITIKPIPALLIETCVLIVPSVIYLLWRAYFFEPLFLRQLDTSLWLIGSGIATSLPLLFFGVATARLKLSTVGLLQYLAPTISFLLGVFVYREDFNEHTLITFCLIWLGVFIYSVGSFRRATRRHF